MNVVCVGVIICLFTGCLGCLFNLSVPYSILQVKVQGHIRPSGSEDKHFVALPIVKVATCHSWQGWATGPRVSFQISRVIAKQLRSGLVLPVMPTTHNKERHEQPKKGKLDRDSCAFLPKLIFAVSQFFVACFVRDKAPDDKLSLSVAGGIPQPGGGRRGPAG